MCSTSKIINLIFQLINFTINYLNEIEAHGEESQTNQNQNEIQNHIIDIVENNIAQTDGRNTDKVKIYCS